MIARLRADARTLPVLAAIVVAFGILAAGNATFAQAGTYAAIYAIAAIGLSLLIGNVNQISLGAAGFFGIGAYAVACADDDLEFAGVAFVAARGPDRHRLPRRWSALASASSRCAFAATTSRWQRSRSA